MTFCLVQSDYFMYDWRLNLVYNLDGIRGIYKLLLHTHLQSVKCNRKNELTWDQTQNTFRYMNKDVLLINCIICMLRKRYLARKYACLWKQKTFPIQDMNDTDLCMNTFTKEDTLNLSINQKRFRFTSTELVQIFVNALEYREDIIPYPKYPKNPYTNNIFSIEECTLIYQFLSKHIQKIPDVIQFFYVHQFDMLMFYQLSKEFLKYRACQNYCDALSISKKTKQLGIMFDTFDVTNPPSKLSMNLYIKKHYSSIKSLFYYYLYQFHYTDDMMFIIHLKHYLITLNDEIKILGKSYRKTYKVCLNTNR